MKKLCVALGLGLALAFPAHAQESKAALQAEIAAQFPDNTVQAITPAILRSVTNDFVLSWIDWTTCSGNGANGLPYWNQSGPTYGCLNIGSGLSIVGGALTAAGSPPGGASGNVQTNNGSGGFAGITNTQLTALINPATASLSGALPAWPNNTTTYFRGDGTYATLNCAALATPCLTGLTIGTTTIASGTTTRLLYDLAGVLQESSILTLTSGGPFNAITSGNLAGNFLNPSTAAADSGIAGTTTGTTVNIFNGSTGTPMSSVNPSVMMYRVETVAGGLNATSATLLAGNTAVSETSGAQNVAIYAYTGKDVNSTGDTTPIIGIGKHFGTSGTAFGGYFEGDARKIGSSTTNAIAIETDTVNGTGTATPYNPTPGTVPAMMGLDIAYTGTFGGSSAANGGPAIQIRAITQQWDVGIGFMNGSPIVTADIQSDTSAVNLWLANSGAHTHGLKWTAATFSTDAIATPGFTVAGLGNTTLNVIRTIASATGATLDDLNIQASTTTISGTTAITKLAKVGIYRPTLTDGSAVTVSDVSSLYIDNAPNCAGSVTCTRPWALWANNGNTLLGANFSGGGLGQLTINSGANGTVLFGRSSVSNTAVGTYYNGSIIFFLEADATNNDTQAFDFRGANGNSYAALVAQITDQTAGAVKGKLALGVANGGAAAVNFAYIEPTGCLNVGTDADCGAGNINVTSHYRSSGAAPSLGACGTSPSISGTDAAGKITAGSGVLSSCVITFAATYTTAPACTVSSPTAIASLTVASTATTLTIGGTTLTSDVIAYHCTGQS